LETSEQKVDKEKKRYYARVAILGFNIASEKGREKREKNKLLLHGGFEFGQAKTPPSRA